MYSNNDKIIFLNYRASTCNQSQRQSLLHWKHCPLNFVSNNNLLAGTGGPTLLQSKPGMLLRALGRFWLSPSAFLVQSRLHRFLIIFNVSLTTLEDNLKCTLRCPSSCLSECFTFVFVLLLLTLEDIL